MSRLKSKDNISALPKIIVITGPSGSGQTSLASALLKKRKCLGLVRGTTTRPRQKRRGGDRDHIFVRPATFLELKRSGAFVETDRNVGHYYGTSWREINRVLRQGKIPLLTLTVPGFRKIVKSNRFEVCSIFIKAENLSILKKRILARQKDLSLARLKARLVAAKKVLLAKKEYQKVIINRQNRLPDTVREALKYVDTCLELH